MSIAYFTYFIQNYTKIVYIRCIFRALFFLGICKNVPDGKAVRDVDSHAVIALCFRLDQAVISVFSAIQNIDLLRGCILKNIKGMPEQFDLQHGLLLAHWLNIEPLDTNDARSFLFVIVFKRFGVHRFVKFKAPERRLFSSLVR